MEKDSKKIVLLYRMIKDSTGLLVWVKTTAKTSDFVEMQLCPPVPSEKRTDTGENLDMIRGIDEQKFAHVFLGRWNGGKKEPYLKSGLILN